MQIAGLQKLTLLDYPGRCAATVFTPGCDLRCPFCHNASLAEASFMTESAPGCNSADVLLFLKNRIGKLTGVAITGGEPLMQPDIEDFMYYAKALGYRVKLDTNGTYPDRLKSILDKGLADYVAMDIKNCDAHWALTAGIDINKSMPLLEKIHQSMDILRSWDGEFEFRTTLAFPLHTAEDMIALGEMLSGPLFSGEPAKPVEKYFLQNFVDSGDILMGGISALPPDTMQSYLELVRKYIPTAELRGL